jgi:hypothetical protein
LTDCPTRHSVLKKTRTFSGSRNHRGLTGWLEKPQGQQPIDISNDDNTPPPVIREESPDEEANLADIPAESPGIRTSPSAIPETNTDGEKLVPQIEYEGFSIHGRVLCLVVKRKNSASASASSSQQMMENWMSTQVLREN